VSCCPWRGLVVPPGLDGLAADVDHEGVFLGLVAGCDVDEQPDCVQGGGDEDGGALSVDAGDGHAERVVLDDRGDDPGGQHWAAGAGNEPGDGSQRILGGQRVGGGEHRMDVVECRGVAVVGRRARPRDRDWAVGHW
jgi:hypothetical protein